MRTVVQEMQMRCTVHFQYGPQVMREASSLTIAPPLLLAPDQAVGQPAILLVCMSVIPEANM